VVTPTSNAAAAFQRDGAGYFHNFLEPYDFDAVRREVRRLRGKMKKEKDSIAVNRHGCCLDGGSIAHECLTSERTARRLNALLGDGSLRPGDYPIEARVYKRGGEMEWHRDDVLYAEPQVELVLTLENDSDSQTQWVDAAGTLHAEVCPEGIDPYDIDGTFSYVEWVHRCVQQLVGLGCDCSDSASHLATRSDGRPLLRTVIIARGATALRSLTRALGRS